MHLECGENMIPVFFAFGHFYYNTYALYYMRSMNDLPNDVSQAFMKSHHTMVHKVGIVNGILKLSDLPSDVLVAL